MKANPSILIVKAFCLLLVTLIAACAPTRRSPSPSGLPTDKTATTETPSAGTTSPPDQNLDGASSGGGGFVDENSTLILRMAAEELARIIRRSSPQIYANLPDDWSPERLASVIESVRYEPTIDGRKREGRLLMFDYDKKDNYILALKPFFVAYSSFPIKFAKRETLSNLMKDVRLKLIHEAGHLLDLDEDKAEQFGLDLLASLRSDILHCETQDAGAYPGGKYDKDPTRLESMGLKDVALGPLGYDWVFHRATGLGVVNSSLNVWGTAGGKDRVEWELSRKKTNDDLFSSGIYSSLDDDIHSGCINKKDRCANVPVLNTFFWESSFVAGTEKLSYKAQHPNTTAETLTIEKTTEGKYKGTLVYIRAGANKPESFEVNCRSKFEPVRFDKSL